MGQHAVNRVLVDGRKHRPQVGHFALSLHLLKQNTTTVKRQRKLFFTAAKAATLETPPRLAARGKEMPSVLSKVTDPRAISAVIAGALVVYYYSKGQGRK